MEKKRKTWSGLFVKALMGVLVLSFAVAGMAELFSGSSPNTLAQVGSQRVSPEDFRRAFTQAVQQESQQRKQPISIPQARQMGLDQRVLSQLVLEAVVDESARRMGLTITDDKVAKTIFETDAFKGPNGSFTPDRLAMYLRNANITEAQLLEQQRQFLLRQQLIQGLTLNVEKAPQPLMEAVHAFQNEVRDLTFVTLSASMLPPLSDPDDKALEAFYNERKSRFAVPELRRFHVLQLNAETLDIAQFITDADVRAYYEANSDNYSTPEKRTVQRMTFRSMDEANGAAAKIASGMTFEQIMAEEKANPSDVNLGSVTKEAIIDTAIADKAFSIPLNQAEPVQGRFAPALVRVTAVEPAQVRSFEDSAADIRRQMVDERTRTRLNELHSQIENQRISGAELREISDELKLPLKTFENVDAQGRNAEGQPVEGLPDNRVLAGVFESDVGVDNDAVQISQSDYAWFDVSAVTPQRERTFSEAREKALKNWREQEIQKQLDQRASGIVKELSEGGTIAAVAETLKTQTQTRESVSRTFGSEAFSENALSRVFATPLDSYGTATGQSPDERVIFQITRRDVPAFNAEAIAPLAQQLAQSYEADILDTYIAQQHAEMNVRINPQVLAPILGTQINN
jgi:peptidyl-prolyl cis-trans isomerase D